MNKRRPTKQIERLLEITEQSHRSLIKSTGYVKASRHKSAPEWDIALREMRAMRFGFKSALEWVLGRGLTDVEMDRLFTELDEEYSNSE